jgi:hypothetical protein
MPQGDDSFWLITFEKKSPTAPQRLKQRLDKESPPSWVKLVKVYCLTRFHYIYNKQALKLSEEWGIIVPRKGAQEMTWAKPGELPALREVVKWPKPQ